MKDPARNPLHQAADRRPSRPSMPSMGARIMGTDGKIRYISTSGHVVLPSGLNASSSPASNSPARGGPLQHRSGKGGKGEKNQGVQKRWIPAKAGASGLRPLRPPSPEILLDMQRLERRGEVFRQAVRGLNLREESRARSLPALDAGAGSTKRRETTRSVSESEASMQCKAQLARVMAEQRRLSLLAEQQVHFFELMSSPKNKKRLGGLKVEEDSDEEDELYALRQPTLVSNSNQPGPGGGGASPGSHGAQPLSVSPNSRAPNLGRSGSTVTGVTSP